MINWLPLAEPTHAGVPRQHQRDQLLGQSRRNLALRAGKGDAAAFGALYDRYVEAVYRYVFYRVRNDADAEDLVSDVFMTSVHP